MNQTKYVMAEFSVSRGNFGDAKYCLIRYLEEEHDDDIRRCAQNLVEAELVDMMGSDAHRIGHRPPKLARGERYIRENCRAEYAENILWRNAEKFLKV